MLAVRLRSGVFKPPAFWNKRRPCPVARIVSARCCAVRSAPGAVLTPAFISKLRLRRRGILLGPEPQIGREPGKVGGHVLQRYFRIVLPPSVRQTRFPSFHSFFSSFHLVVTSSVPAFLSFFLPSISVLLNAAAALSAEQRGKAAV